MKDNEKINLKDLISQIHQNEVLIPDFQRGFVWENIEDQKRLLSSVFSRLPIGSILMLKGNVEEFRCKIVGTKNYVEIQNSDSQSKKFLIDGQQRVTVLINAFTDLIASKSDEEIASKMLRYRFFIKLRIEDFKNIDLFGLTNLMFPFTDLTKSYFLGNEMLAVIFEESSVNHETFPPDFKINSYVQSDVVADSCVTLKTKEANIPLCILLEDKFGTVYDILNKISTNREKEIGDYASEYFQDINKTKYLEFLDTLRKLGMDETYLHELQDSNNYKKILKKMRENWVIYFKQYIDLCVHDLKFYEITVSESERDRAIDIYENLNMGGVTLTTFDLLVAKVARIDRIDPKNFIDQIIEVLNAKIEVHINHDFHKYLLENEISDLIENLRIYKDKELNPTFQNVLMNLLAIEFRTQTSGVSNLSLNDLKKEKILELSPEFIYENYYKAVVGIKRALFFMNHELGISRIEDVLYEHVLLNISRILSDDALWEDNYTFKKLKFWYWIVLFSGSYDKDQSKQMINDMKLLDKFILENDSNIEVLTHKIGSIFSEHHYFTNKQILLMKEVKKNQLPKTVIQKMILQYILSKKPADILNVDQTNAKTLTSYEGISIEKHHLIPLSGVTKIMESTRRIRRNKEHLLNSPINFTVITKEANKKISSSGLHEYYVKISHSAFTGHSIPTGIDANLYERMRNANEEEFLKLSSDWLGYRYDTLKSDILATITSLQRSIL